ncbi:MAG: TonB-dependent receptor plug domain-containing protein, partial [Polyangiaceae bacterium]
MLLVVDLMARAAAGQSTSSNADAGREANNPGSSPARVDGDGGSRDAGSPSSDKGDLAAHHPDVGDAAAPDGAKSETPEAANSGGSTPPASDAGATPPPPSQATPPEDTEGASELSTVVVTGTRRSERTVFESNVPVDVVAATSLHTVPSSDLNDKIAATVPSYSVQRLPLSDGAIFNRPATLRGLSPDQTLVLINGKRRHRSAYIDVTAMGAQAVDLAEIPLAAIDHVEVLRDGASAQYGSDAIAGVINIILKDKPGFDGYLQAGQYYAGDGANYLLGANQGFALG